MPRALSGFGHISHQSPTMDYTRFAVELTHPLPELTGLPCDRLLIRVGHLDPLLLVRSLPPNWGAVGEAIAHGRVFPIDPIDPEDVMRVLASAAASLPWPVPAPNPTPGRPARPSRVLRFPSR